MARRRVGVPSVRGRTWNPADHPRDPRTGRFIKKGGGQVRGQLDAVDTVDRQDRARAASRAAADKRREAAARRRADAHQARIRQMDDGQLADEFARISTADDLDAGAFERVVDEMDRRDRGGQPDVDPEVADRERRIDELVSRGWEYRDAYAEVLGLSSDELLAQERRDMVRAERRGGESLDQTVRRMYQERTALQYLAAEEYTRGHLLNPEGRAAGVDPVWLFSGPVDRARRYASSDLLEFWETQQPRQTATEFRADMLGRARDVAAAQRTRGRGRDREIAGRPARRARAGAGARG